MYFLEILILAAALGLLPAFIARDKGRNFFKWWAYGALVFIIALPHSLMLPSMGVKKCPYCKSMVRADSPYCRHCGHEFMEL